MTMEEHKEDSAQKAERDLADLTTALGSQLDVSLIPNNPYLPHPEYSKSKAVKRRRGEQDERRQHLLKRRRVEVESSPSDTSIVPKTKNWYSERLMLSEWLVDIPDDLAANWLVKLCPEGRHVLLVASSGRTSVYSKSGHKIATFLSHLPGGNRDYPGRFTMLDCIWNEKNKTYYVLDVLEWNCQTMLNCDTTFRFFWLASKFEDLKELEVKSNKNTCPLLLVPSFECTPEILTDLMSKYPYYEGGPDLDGVLFYHKESGYSSGATPLVTWLKPFMVEDILQIPVAEGYNQQRPPGYESQKSYIEKGKVEKKGRSHFPRQAKDENSQQGDGASMDTELVQENSDQK